MGSLDVDVASSQFSFYYFFNFIYLFIYSSAIPPGMWDLISPTRE